MSKVTKTTHAQMTEFGPVQTHETIAYESCATCDQLQSKLQKQKDAICEMAEALTEAKEDLYAVGWKPQYLKVLTKHKTLIQECKGAKNGPR